MLLHWWNRKILDQYFTKAKPEDIKATDYTSYGKLLLKLKEDSLANEAFAKGIKMDSADLEVLELHADTYFKRKKYEEAAEAFKQLISATEKKSPNDLWRMGNAYYFSAQYVEADSAFTELSEIVPTQTFGYLWAAKSRVQYDSTGETGVAVPMYEKFVEKALENPEKNKKDLIDAYDYLGMYALHKSTNEKEGLAKATLYFKKVLELDPNNERAKEFMETVKEMNNPTQGKRQK